jgi:hypothetical protein
VIDRHENHDEATHPVERHDPAAIAGGVAAGAEGIARSVILVPSGESLRALLEAF